MTFVVSSVLATMVPPAALTPRLPPWKPVARPHRRRRRGLACRPPHVWLVDTAQQLGHLARACDSGRAAGKPASPGPLARHRPAVSRAGGAPPERGGANAGSAATLTGARRPVATVGRQTAGDRISGSPSDSLCAPRVSEGLRRTFGCSGCRSAFCSEKRTGKDGKSCAPQGNRVANGPNLHKTGN
jgi:hypothetical protein